MDWVELEREGGWKDERIGEDEKREKEEGQKETRREPVGCCHAGGCCYLILSFEGRV